MLVSNDRRFIVPTATKTGTFSVESCLNGRGFHRLLPRHRDTVPSTHKGSEALMLVRDPYARLVSMYRYGKVKKHSFLLKLGEGGFPMFVTQWCMLRKAGKGPHDWMTLLAEYVDRIAKSGARKVTTYRLESAGVAELLKRVRVEYPRHTYPTDKHINESADRFDEPWQALWTPQLVRLAAPLLAPDCALGEYRAPK